VFWRKIWGENYSEINNKMCFCIEKHWLWLKLIQIYYIYDKNVIIDIDIHDVLFLKIFFLFLVKYWGKQNTVFYQFKWYLHFWKSQCILRD
jgi:hypothetical protein